LLHPSRQCSSDVKQTGHKVESGVKVAHGNLQGTMNVQGTELTGQWRREENSLPLTLRKKQVLKTGVAVRLGPVQLVGHPEAGPKRRSRKLALD
jgi:hypothetical protein